VPINSGRKKNKGSLVRAMLSPKGGSDYVIQYRVAVCLLCSVSLNTHNYYTICIGCYTMIVYWSCNSFASFLLLSLDVLFDWLHRIRQSLPPTTARSDSHRTKVGCSTRDLRARSCLHTYIQELFVSAYHRVSLLMNGAAVLLARTAFVAGARRII
jgi:hypothetical protein